MPPLPTRAVAVGLTLTVLSTLESWVQGTRQPDLTFLFDLPPAVAAARLAGARQPRSL